ncbi:DUF1648 domain-containing protein [Clostridium sp. B9]|uniref:DUF1648 domain-containing protein n=1 Tax=Clostridium sp. B9 TaxID=3423224 RepID=UPI003D2F1477
MAKWKCSEENRRFNRILDFVNLAIIIIMAGITTMFWSKLPVVIATHYGFNGKVDAYGSKNTLFIILPFMIFIYLLFRFISNRPNICNYTVRITPLNREEQYNLVSKFLRIFCLEILILFTYIQANILYSAVTRKEHISLIFIPVIILGLIITTIIYNKKSKAIA